MCGRRSDEILVRSGGLLVEGLDGVVVTEGKYIESMSETFSRVHNGLSFRNERKVKSSSRS